MRIVVPLLALSLLFCVAAPGAAQAQFDDDWRYYRSDGNAQPLDRILPQIRRNHPGRFYDAEGPFMGADGQMHYRLKWMTPEGRVVWFDTDARTGRVLGTVGGRREFEGEGEGPPFGGPRREDPRNWGGGHDWGRGRDWGDGRDWGGGHGWGGGFWGGGGHGRHGH